MNGIKPTFLRVFQMMSGLVDTRIGWSQDPIEILALIKRMRFSIKLVKYKNKS